MTLPSAGGEHLNPYERFLGPDTPLDVLEATQDRLAELLGGLDAAVLARRPSPTKWSIRDIVCHLADTEIVFAFRLRQTVAQPHHVIQPYDQDAWAAASASPDVASALATFRAVRDWNVRFARAVLPQAANKPVTHPERGAMTFSVILQTMAGHDENHLRQIENLASRRM